MRPRVRITIAVGVLIVGACAVFALLFVARTNNRLDRLEDYLTGRRETRDSQYQEQKDDIREQQLEIDDLRRQLCQLQPTTCNAGE